MSGSFTISIDPVSFADALATMRILKSILPTNAVSTISECAEQTKDQIVSETVKVLNIDEDRVKDEISVECPSSETLKDYKAVIVSRGKPIELIAFSEDAGGWNWKKPTPIHARIYRQGATHEFRHSFVSNGHIYGRKQYTGGGEATGRVYGWMKYAAKDKALRFPIEILRTVRVQDIQDKTQLIDPVIETGADAVVSDFKKAIDEVFTNA
jgi:hypothetical protein